MTARKTTYSWRDGYMFGRNVPPQKVGEALERLRKENDGLLTTEIVLKAAEDPASILHNCFEWDDAKGAEKYRLEQARQMLAGLIVTVPTLPVERGVRAFVNVIEADGDRGYTSMVLAMADEELRKQVLQRAFRELQIFQRRYEEYEELAEVMRAIERTTKKGRKKRNG